MISDRETCERLVNEKRAFEALRSKRISYDADRDEILLHTENGQNPDQAQQGNGGAVWRVTQEGKISEVFSYHRAGPKIANTKNTIPGQITAIDYVSLDPEGNVWFYQHSVEKSVPSGLMRIKKGERIPKPVTLNQGRLTNMQMISSGGAACFDKQGFGYFKTGNSIVRLNTTTLQPAVWVY